MPNETNSKDLQSTTIKTEWDLSHIYRSIDEIESDLEKAQKTYKRFEQKYKKNTSWVEKEETLLKALKAYEKLYDTNLHKPYRYLAFLKDLDSSNIEVRSRLSLVEERLSKISNHILFFPIALGGISKKDQKKYLKSPRLAHFHYFLERVFQESEYYLTEPEEKILNLKSLPSYSLWVQGVKKARSTKTVKVKGKERPLPEVFNMLRELPTAPRRKAWKEAMKKLQEVGEFAESEINAVVINKKISDELRGYEKPYSSTILSYENEEKSVEELVDIVSKNFKISQKYYALKKDLLGLKTLEYSDRSAAVGKIKKKFSFDHSVEILRTSFEKADPEFRHILDRMLANGQIDVFPRIGKSGGAYCAGSENLPTYVLLNHVDSFGSLNTFAHEMGHAIHYEYSKSQPLLYQDFSISIAEVASTLFENFAFDEVFSELSEQEKVIALHDRVDGSMSTIFRQVALFNFETELHTRIRTEGFLSIEDIALLLNKHMGSYLGSAVDIKTEDGYSIIDWSHIRYFFYVYAYAYGELISNALYEKYLEDNSFIEKIKVFLSAGGSMTPEDVFKSIGIDTSKAEFWELGLKKINNDVNRLKREAKKAGMLKF